MYTPVKAASASASSILISKLYPSFLFNTTSMKASSQYCKRYNSILYSFSLDIQ